MRREVGDTLVEGDLAAAGNQAVEFSFRTLTELAEPAQIIVGAGFDQKNVQLVISNADPCSFLKRLAQGKRSGAAQFAEAFLGVEPECQIEIAAFMLDLNPCAPEFAEARHLFPKRLRDGADNGDRRHLAKTRPGIGDDIRRRAELPLAFQHVAILLFNRRAPHVRPTVS
jgi:hypothetical protein